MPRCWRPLCSQPAAPAAAVAALNRARRAARRWCSISRPTPPTRASTPRSAQGYYRDAGVDLTIHEPGESTDAPKLLAAGRTDFAILDIHDLGIARERGLDVVGVMPIVQRPLASVIARGDGPVRRPRELEGHTVGVTGLPSDEAVVDSEVSADGGDPAGVHRVTIGFNAVSALAAGRVDAATGFWNAEGVALRRTGRPGPDLQGEPLRRPALPGARPRRLAPRPSQQARAGRRRGRRDDPRLQLRGRRTRQGAGRSRRRRPRPRPRRPGRPAQRPAARPPPRPVRPARAARMGGLGPRARPARKGRSTSGRLPLPPQDSAAPAQPASRAARPAPAAPAPSASAARRGRRRRPRPRAGSRRRRGSRSRATGRPSPAKASGSAASRSATISSTPSGSASGSEADDRHLVAGGAEPLRDPAGEHQVGDDGEDPRHQPRHRRH